MFYFKEMARITANFLELFEDFKDKLWYYWDDLLELSQYVGLFLLFPIVVVVIPIITTWKRLEFKTLKSFYWVLVLVFANYFKANKLYAKADSKLDGLGIKDINYKPKGE